MVSVPSVANDNLYGLATAGKSSLTRGELQYGMTLKFGVTDTIFRAIRRPVPVAILHDVEGQRIPYHH